MRYFKLAEVAELFGVSLSTAKRWADEGMLKTEPIPGGCLRRTTAVHIRNFARQHKVSTLQAFGGILGVGRFRQQAPESVRVVPSLVGAGRQIELSFPSVVMVSYVDFRHIDLPEEFRASGYDGMIGCVVGDDETQPVEKLQEYGWQLVCRESDDYWGAAKRIEQQTTMWWGKIPAGGEAC